MTVDAALGAAFENVASRERDAMRAFNPTATPERDDVRAARRKLIFDPLSVTLPEHAYAIVAGDGGARWYTHDAAFRVDDGRIEDAAGRPVLGYLKPGAALSELRVDPVDAALHRADDLRVEEDGSVSYARRAYDPRSGAPVVERIAVGRIALARFPAGTALRAADAAHVAAPAGVIAHVGVPGDGAFGALLPMRRSVGRIDIDASLVKLREAYLALDALRAARVAQKGVEKNAMDLLK